MAPRSHSAHPDQSQLRPGSRSRLLLGGAFGWGLAMVASLLFSQWQLTRLNSFHLAGLALIYFAGGCLGWLTALPIAARVTRRRRAETRFAACFFGLSIGTIGFTATLFALQYRIFYAQWHDRIGSVGWAVAFVETCAGAVYQFLVLGLPHYVPLAFPALLATSFWLATRPR